MTGLQEHLERYLALRRSLGYQLVEHGDVLPDFVRYAHARGETTVRAATALAWAGDACSDGQRGRRLSMVRGLARYLTAFDASTEIPPPGQFGAALRGTPHIYCEQEIAALMRSASGFAPAPFAATMATLIGLMSSTGLRPGEIRRLDRGDVNPVAAQITIWHSKSGRSRRLPLHESTVAALADYAATRDHAHPHPRDAAFFPDRKGCRLTTPVLGAAFRELRQRASISTPASQRSALIGDLRHTFAVNTLLSWHRDGADVQQRLPVLSAYLGHVNPEQTYWYLQATPELMALIAQRLQRSWEAGR
jgi:integrase